MAASRRGESCTNAQQRPDQLLELDQQGVRGVNDYADRVLRDKRYKVWLGNSPEIAELYDLKTDPLEQKNLIDSQQSEHVAALARFQAIVDSQPSTDARPQYRPRPANSWDRSLIGKEGRSRKRRRPE